MILDSQGNITSSNHFKYTKDYYKSQLDTFGHNGPRKGNNMNERTTDAGRLDAETADMAVHAGLGLPVVAEADGTLHFANAVTDGEHVDAGETIAFVQPDEEDDLATRH